MAHSPRGWTGARTPSAIKSVRQAQRRHAVNQPRRTAAKTLVTKALASANDAASNGGSAQDVQAAVGRAVSALDRAAKIGAIHQNAADRRKSRLMLKVNAVLGGQAVAAPAHQARTTGKAAAAKQARQRIAASRATKAKGEQTAAGKARAALARSTRSTTEEAPATTAAVAAPTTTAKATAQGEGAGQGDGAAKAKAPAKATAAKAKAPAKATAAKAKTAGKASTAKATGGQDDCRPRRAPPSHASRRRARPRSSGAAALTAPAG